MTWGFVFLLAGTAYAFKVLGLVVIGDRVLPPVLDRCLTLIPPALIAAIVVSDTFTVAQHTLGIDRPRVAAVGVAELLAWRRTPFAVIIVVAAATAALMRAVG